MTRGGTHHRSACWAVLWATALAPLACGGELAPTDDPPRPIVFPVSIRFEEVSSDIGVTHSHRLIHITDSSIQSGGVAAGDYDADGFVDLFAVGGDGSPSRLFHNEGDGTFTHRYEENLTLIDRRPNGAVFADYDGDAALDLFVGGVDGTAPALFRGNGKGGFKEVTKAGPAIDAEINPNSWGGTFADYDVDGDLDLFVPHWEFAEPTLPTQHLWENRSGAFVDATQASGIEALFTERDSSFTANFADLDDDGAPDLLLTRDFGQSVVLLGDGEGHFTDVTPPTISDSNGMGSSVGDFDNDGLLDWFVTSIWSPRFDEAKWGNRLYRGLGDGDFEDVSVPAGIREGFWGWASCFADFDNDGHVDIFHVAGIDNRGLPSDGDLVSMGMHENPSSLFLSNGDGTFTESAEEHGIVERKVGIGVSCLDYDRDGDVDIVTTSNRGPLHIFRNEGGEAGQFLGVRLRAPPPNVQAIGAVVRIRAGKRKQLRLITAGSNYLSQNPAEAHFGLADAALVDLVEVTWPDGKVSHLDDVAPRQWLVVDHPDLAPAAQR